MSSNEKFEREFETFLNEEDSRLAALYRKLPQAEPDARLDAAVRSMAYRALNPQLVATPRASIARRRVGRWVPALGAAAGIVLAAGVAFRLGPSLNDTSYRDAAPPNDVISVRPVDEPAPGTAPPLSPAPPPLVSAPATTTAAARPQPAKPEGATIAPPAPAPALKAAAVEEQEKTKLSSLPDEQRAAAPAAAGAVHATPKSRPAPRPFPAETRAPRQAPQIDAVERKQIMATGASQNQHDRDERDVAAGASRERSLDDKADAGAAARNVATPAVAPAAPPPATTAASPIAAEAPTAKDTQPAAADRSAARLREVAPQAPPSPPPREAPSPTTAAEVAAPQAAGAARSDESANQPGGALKKERAKSADPNARLYPEHWLANIRTMLEKNRRDEALRSLAEFRRMYPDYKLPDDLRNLK